MKIGELVLKVNALQKRIVHHQDGIKQLVEEAKPLNERLEKLIATAEPVDAEKWPEGVSSSVCCSKSSEK